MKVVLFCGAVYYAEVKALGKNLPLVLLVIYQNFLLFCAGTLCEVKGFYTETL